MRVCITALLLLFWAGQITFAQPAQPPRDENWRQDLKFLASGLALKHKNLFFQLKREDFERETARIDSAIPKLSDAQIKIEFIRLVAMAGDGHTQVLWRAGDFHSIPIAFYRFSDGWYVVRADEEYKAAVGKRLLKIGGAEIESVVKKLKPLIACDNEPCFKDRLSRYLNVADFLYEMKLSRAIDQAGFTFEDPAGKEFTMALKGAYPEGLKDMKLISAFDEAKAAIPLYRRNPSLFYWREYLPDAKTLYINYRSCKEMLSLPFKQFAAESLAFIDSNPLERIVIDVRNNGGGSESIIRPLIEGLRQRSKFTQKGAVFVVVGRGTYSSASNNAFEIKEKLNAIFVGEPSGQKPNHYGEIRMLKLPNSGLEIGYSSNFFKRMNGDPMAIMPDIKAELSFADYLAGRDPALAAILKFPQK